MNKLKDICRKYGLTISEQKLSEFLSDLEQDYNLCKGDFDNVEFNKWFDNLSDLEIVDELETRGF